MAPIGFNRTPAKPRLAEVIEIAVTAVSQQLETAGMFVVSTRPASDANRE
jgi:hypothetical protein